jgi:hypothetical protein
MEISELYRKDGRIMPMFEERLRRLGYWLGVNGEAIYSTIPRSHQNDTLTDKEWYVLSIVKKNTVFFKVYYNCTAKIMEVIICLKFYHGLAAC